MSITNGDYDLHKSGNRDSARHKEKLRDAFKKKLTDIISEENIITSEKGKTVKVPIKALDNYRFVFDPKKQKHVGQGDKNTKEGDILQKEEEGTEKNPKAGDQEGDEYYEAEIDLDELIEMMLEDLHLPRLDPKKNADLKNVDIRFDDLRRKGIISHLDKKKTLIENIKRNSRVDGTSKVYGINDDDLRFRTWREHFKPVTSAVIFCQRDCSGSMDVDKVYISRSFFFWMVNFLKAKYEEVDIVFVSHTTEAKECTEHDFFHLKESGGTKVSSSYRLVLKIIGERYSPDNWNIFSFHFSDGDTFSDEEECVDLLRKTCDVSTMVGYAEISPYFGTEYSWTHATLFDHYEKTLTDLPNFVSYQLKNKDDVYPALKKFFSDE